MSLPQTYKALYSSASHGGNPEIREVPLQHPGKNQVLVKIEYTPVNPTDIFSGNNTFYTPDSNEQNRIGSEGAGIIVEVGQDLETPFKVGDRVHVIEQAWAQYGVYDTSSVFLVQEGLSLEEAASHFVNPMTVYNAGVLAKKENVKAVIHTAGSSALGRMLIRYFKQLGIKLINVVRKEEYVEELKREGADYVLNSQSEDFEKKLKEIVQKEKATMAFEAVAGEFTNKILNALPDGSIVFVYGKLSSNKIEVDVLHLFKRKIIAGMFMPNYAQQLKEDGTWRQTMGEVHAMLNGVLGSKIQKVFKLEDWEEAVKYQKSYGSNGKILLKPN